MAQNNSRGQKPNINTILNDLNHHQLLVHYFKCFAYYISTIFFLKLLYTCLNYLNWNFLQLLVHSIHYFELHLQVLLNHANLVLLKPLHLYTKEFDKTIIMFSQLNVMMNITWQYNEFHVWYTIHNMIT